MILSRGYSIGNIAFIVVYLLFICLVVAGIIFLIIRLSKHSNPAPQPIPNNKYEVLKAKVYEMADRYGVDTVMERIKDIEKELRESR